MTRECGWHNCQLNVSHNGYFCENHWLLVPLENRHNLLAYPWRPGRPPDGRNAALHACLVALRRKLEPGKAYNPVPEPTDDAAP